MPAALPFSAVDDPWLSRLLSRPAVRLSPSEGDIDLEQRLRAERLFATAKVSADNVKHLQALQAVGFYAVDVLLGFSAPTSETRRPNSAISVRPAAAADVAQVRVIASAAFRYTRFHLDPAIPDTLAAHIKAEWAANFFAGRRGDGMFVAEDAHGRIRGFLLTLNAGDSLIIDLIAVSTDASGEGIGTALVSALAGQAERQGKSRLQVGTQAANAPAARFYEKCGFRLQSAQYVLHHHGTDTEYPTGPT